MGELSANLLMLAIPGFITAWAWTRCCPMSYELLTASFCLGFAAGFVALLVELVIGLATFYLEDITAFFWI